MKCASVAQPIGALSGGNQQKVALARLLHEGGDVWLLDEPTRGIDVGTKAEIWRLIGERAASSGAVIVISSYLPELLNVCDRVAVFCKGELRALRRSRRSSGSYSSCWRSGRGAASRSPMRRS